MSTLYWNRTVGFTDESGEPCDIPETDVVIYNDDRVTKRQRKIVEDNRGYSLEGTVANHLMRGYPSVEVYRRGTTHY